MNANRRVVLEVVRTHDPDRYVSMLFVPKPWQFSLFTLYAFNVELARIADQISEPLLGEMRLEWWRGAIDTKGRGDAGEEERTGHPIADSMRMLMQATQLNKNLLLGMIDARSFDVTDTIMPDRSALNAYLNKTAGALFLAASDIVAGGRVELAEKAAHVSGQVYGLTGLIRSLPIHATQRKLYLPRAYFEDFGVHIEDIFRGQESAELFKALDALKTEIREHLAGARKLISSFPSEMQRVFLPLVLIEPYLEQHDRSGHRPLHDLIDQNPLARLWRLWRGVRRGV